MSVPLKRQAEALRIRELYVPSRRSRSGIRRLGPSHQQLLVDVYAWRDKVYWGNERIAEELGVCKRQVQRLRRDLEAVQVVDLVERGGGRLKGTHRRADGHFTGRAHKAIAQPEKATCVSPYPGSKGDVRVTLSERHRVTPMSPPYELNEGKQETGEATGDEVRIVSPAGSTPETVSNAQSTAPSTLAARESFAPQAPLRPPAAVTGAAAGAGAEGVSFAKAKTDHSTAGDACASCKRPITVFGRGHQPGCDRFGMGPLVEQCSNCGRLVDVLNHRGYHLMSCPQLAKAQGLFGPVDGAPPGTRRKPRNGSPAAAGRSKQGLFDELDQ